MFHKIISCLQEQVRIWNHQKKGAQRLADELGNKCVAVSTVSEAVEDADVIVTATSATEPVLKLDWVQPGAHINGEPFRYSSVIIPSL